MILKPRKIHPDIEIVIRTDSDFNCMLFYNLLNGYNLISVICSFCHQKFVSRGFQATVDRICQL